MVVVGLSVSEESLHRLESGSCVVGKCLVGPWLGRWLFRRGWRGFGCRCQLLRLLLEGTPGWVQN